MGFMIFLIGVAGIAGAIELNQNPAFAIVLTIIGAVIFKIECKLDDESQIKGGDCQAYRKENKNVFHR